MHTDTRRLRVLQVAARYLPDLGGIESHIHEVTTRMAVAPDLELTVLATDRSGALPHDVTTPQGFRVLRVPAYPKSRDYYFAPGLRSVLRDGDWDIVHFQGIHTLVPALGMPLARRAGLRYLLTLHTGGSSSGFRTAARSAQWRLLGPSMRAASRLVAVSRFERDLVARSARIDPARFTVIRNGGSLPAPEPPVTPVPGRVVTSGRLERYKGHHRVIAALPRLAETVPSAHVRVLGSGPFESELRALADRLGVADRVEIRYVDPADRMGMARELAGAAAVAALSDYEAHPVAVMEALTLGRPVVGLDVAGIGDLVEDRLVTGVDARASASEVAATLAHVLAADARPPSGTLPTWDSCAEQLVELYRTVAAERA